jgi:uncharacterized protein (DUF1800 family)
VLGAGLGGALAVGLTSRSASAATPTPRDRAGRRRAPREPLLTLVNRTSQGFTTELWTEAQTRGYRAYLEWQLDPVNIDDSALDVRLADYPSIAMTSREIQDVYVLTGQFHTPVTEIQTSHVLRSMLSKRQLLERMVEFWSDHFNINGDFGELQALKTADDRDVIRAHALGKFPDLLSASAHSAAMLSYLDNALNTNLGAQENYARELLELHTLSPGNYTETDVRELARVLTGWTYLPTTDPLYGTFHFESSAHDNGVHNVLGHTFGPNAGQSEGEALLAILVAHPATAHFIALKLCRWFLSEEPPTAVVNRVANEYLRTGGDIRVMLREILKQENVQLAGAHERLKLKRPFTFMTSLLRGLHARVLNEPNMMAELKKLGQVPFMWGTPDGYPDQQDYWGTTVLPRWDFASRLCDAAIPGIGIDPIALFGATPPQRAGERCAELLAGGYFDPRDVSEISSFARSFPAFTPAVMRETLALAASSPSFQVY